MSSGGSAVAGPVAVADLRTQVGRLSIAATGDGLLAVAWGDPDELRDRIGPARRVAAAGPAADWAARGQQQVAEYFAGARTAFDLPLDWSLSSGSATTVLTWLAGNVPFGRSISYGQLASRSGTSLPARGIGSVMAGNPLPLVVPCHRVLAANGLGGYSGGAPSNDGSVDPPAERSASGSSTASGGRTPYGLETKRWLLTFEQVLPPTLGWDPARPLESAWTTSAG